MWVLWGVKWLQLKKGYNNMFKEIYKIDKKGKTRIWNVVVDGDTYTVSTGIQGMGQTHNPTTCIGKNIGKKNETTPEQQAIKEATSKRTKQIDRQGYVEDLKDFGQDFSVQLASNYVKTPTKCVKNSTEKMWYQYKLDGLKGYFEDGQMMSRKATVYEKTSDLLIKECKHLHNYLINKFGMVNPIIDGELFINNRFWLEDLNSVIKGGETLSGNDKSDNPFVGFGPDDVKLHICNIYDETIKDKNYEDIIPIIEKCMIDNEYERLNRCKSLEFHFDFLDNYMDMADLREDEGIVIYMNTLYKAGKHDGLWKNKRMQDDEWKITGYKETKTLTEKDGTKVKQFQHICATESGEEFAVRMEGTNLHRQEIGTGKDIGKDLKIRYQGLYKTSKPQFPVGVTTRLKEDI